MLVVPTAANAQTARDTIARAVLAAPGRAHADALVVTWDTDGSRIVLREGTNGFVCWDRSGENGEPAFSVQCTNEGNLARYEQNRAFFTAAESPDEAKALMEAAERDGTREVAVFGSVYYSLRGDLPEYAYRHMTIAVPFATSESLGLPKERLAGAAWIMTPGTSGAHIMVPGR